MGIMSSSSNLATDPSTAPDAANARINGNGNWNGNYSASTGNSSFSTFNGYAEKPVSNIVVLAQIISKETEKLDAYLKETNTPHPSFDYDGPADFPKLPDHMQKTRQEIIRASSELRDLVVGPSETLRWMAWDVSCFPVSHDKFLLDESIAAWLKQSDPNIYTDTFKTTGRK